MDIRKKNEKYKCIHKIIFPFFFLRHTNVFSCYKWHDRFWIEIVCSNMFYWSIFSNINITLCYAQCSTPCLWLDKKMQQWWYHSFFLDNCWLTNIQRYVRRYEIVPTNILHKFEIWYTKQYMMILMLWTETYRQYKCMEHSMFGIIHMSSLHTLKAKL